MFPVCKCGFTDFFPMALDGERGLKMQCLQCGEYTFYAPYPMPAPSLAGSGNGHAPVAAPVQAAQPAQAVRAAPHLKAARRRVARPKAKKVRRR